MSERALHEIYLPPFRAAVREAHTWALMASYNLVNGVPASEHPVLLHDILREEWGFDGVVMSDWFFSVKSTAPSVNAGLDLEMPGPGVWRGEQLLQAVKNGEVAEGAIDESVRRLLLLLSRTGTFTHPEEPPEQAINRPEHRTLIREAAAEGMVLLKNEQNVLPLQRERLSSLVLIGPNAKVAHIMGGGSAQVNPHYVVTPFEGVQTKVGKQVTSGYEQGCTIHKLLPLLDISHLFTDSARTTHGLTIEYFNSTTPTGASVWKEQRQSTEILWFGQLPETVNARQFSIRASGYLIAPETGRYTFSLVSAGLSRLFLDSQEVIENWTDQTQGESYFGMGSTELTYSVDLTAGQEYTLTLEYSKKADIMLSAVRLGCLQPLVADMLEQAATLAAQADAVLIFVGLGSEWESEGFDRADVHLPGAQDALIAKVAEANPRTIVVLNSGSPVAMPWLQKVAAVVQAWYPGQECGNAIADVLFGDVNPFGETAADLPHAYRGQPYLSRLSWRERKGSLQRRNLRRVSLLREEKSYSPVPVRFWPFVYNL